MSDDASSPTSSHLLTKMAERAPTTSDGYDSFEEAIVAARDEIADVTRHPFHHKTLMVISDDQQRILWAVASDGWETDYRPGSSPEMH